MTHLDEVRAANKELVKTKPFVAVFGGGTSGIGECGVQQLAATFGDDGDGLRVYIVGQNMDAAEKIIADCRQICPAGGFKFLKGDLALIKEVDRICAEITQAKQMRTKIQGTAAKIDLLVLCQGILAFSGPVYTEEGLDKYTSLFYYSQMRFAIQLLPLLRESPGGAHVISVLNPQLQGKLVLADLSLRQPGNYGFRNTSSHGATRARNRRKISLSHWYPGYINTNAANAGDLPWWLKFVWNWISSPFIPWIPFEACGQRLLFMSSSRFPPRSAGDDLDPTQRSAAIEVATGTDGAVGSGSYNVLSDYSIYAQQEECKKLRATGVADKIWQHTVDTFKNIEAEKVFSD